MTLTGEQLKGEQTITLLDGKEYTIKFSMNAIILLEKRYGDFEAISTEFSKVNFSNIRFLIWCGTTDNHKGLTEEYIGKHVDLKNLKGTIHTVMSAFRDAFPEGDDGEPTDEMPDHIKAVHEEAKKKD